MTFINSTLKFVGSGIIQALADSIVFRDTHLTSDLPVAETGQATLDNRFVNESILGALNELIDSVYNVSGSQSVSCYTEAVDDELFVHDITHNLGSFNLILQMMDADPVSGPGARNVITSWTPIDSNNVRVELDSAASGFFTVFACGS